MDIKPCVLIVLVNTKSPDERIGDLPAGLGYGDFALLYRQDSPLWQGPCRAWPNAWRPRDSARWDRAYGCIMPGTYSIDYYVSLNNGPSLTINKRGKIPARYQNWNHSGRMEIEDCLVHCGGTGKNPNWPGSGGCITIPKGCWPGFISNFHSGDRGELILKDMPV